MAKGSLKRIRFAGFHKSHVGAIKSCADYLNIPCSAAWVYGMTGSAFMTVMDEDCAAPNIGEPEERMFEAACHIGLNIRGLHTFAETADFERLQREAWDAARNAIDRGMPVFAKELDLGNETSIIHAYNDEGYFTHSWHGVAGMRALTRSYHGKCSAVTIARAHNAVRDPGPASGRTIRFIQETLIKAVLFPCIGRLHARRPTILRRCVPGLVSRLKFRS